MHLTTKLVYPIFFIIKTTESRDIRLSINIVLHLFLTNFTNFIKYHIWLPISSCSIERSFSMYNNLLYSFPSIFNYFDNMNTKNIVTPGQRLGFTQDYTAGSGTYVRGNLLYASVVGVKRVFKPAAEGEASLHYINSTSFIL